ncbi:MAG: hypothetical protein ACOCWN_03730 [Halanaerobium sp.]
MKNRKFPVLFFLEQKFPISDFIRDKEIFVYLQENYDFNRK